LFGLFSLVAVLADTLIARHGIPCRSAAWYSKLLPTFSDALALVRLRVWRDLTFQLSASDPDMVLIPASSSSASMTYSLMPPDVQSLAYTLYINSIQLQLHQVYNHL